MAQHLVYLQHLRPKQHDDAQSAINVHSSHHNQISANCHAQSGSRTFFQSQSNQKTIHGIALSLSRKTAPCLATRSAFLSFKVLYQYGGLQTFQQANQVKSKVQSVQIAAMNMTQVVLSTDCVGTEAGGACKGTNLSHAELQIMRTTLIRGRCVAPLRGRGASMRST